MKIIGELFGKPLAKARRAEEPLALRDTPQSPQPHVFKFRYGYAGRQVFGAVVAVGLGCLFWRLGDSGRFGLFLFPALALVILWLLTFRETQIQTNPPPRVSHQWLFLGFIPIWRREYSLDIFKGVHCRIRDTGENPNSEYTYTVGLVEPSGRFLPVQWFSGGDITEVDGFASRLAEVTGLPLLEPNDI